MLSLRSLAPFQELRGFARVVLDEIQELLAILRRRLEMMLYVLERWPAVGMRQAWGIACEVMDRLERERGN